MKDLEHVLRLFSIRLKVCLVLFDLSRKIISESGSLDIDLIDPVCSSKMFLVTLTLLNKNRSLVYMFSLTDNVHGLNANLLNYSVEKAKYICYFNEQVDQYPEPLRSIQIIVNKLNTIYYIVLSPTPTNDTSIDCGH